MKPIIFNQFGNCCKFFLGRLIYINYILVGLQSLHSRKLVCYLDQSTRLHVKTGYFREDGGGFLEITAVHVASIQVGHLPVNPGHLKTPTWEVRKIKDSSTYFVFYLLVQSSVGVLVMWGSLRPMKTVAVSVVCKPSIIILDTLLL